MSMLRTLLALSAFALQLACLPAAWAQRQVSLFQTESGRALFLLRPEEQNLWHALRLARKHHRWMDVKEVLGALEKLQTAPRHGRDWEALIGDLETAVASVGDGNCGS